MINLINTWLRVSTQDTVPTFQYLIKANVSNIKIGAGFLSKTQQAMGKVEGFGRDEKYGSQKVSGVVHKSI